MTDARICYGISFPVDTVFPWDSNRSGIEDWWIYDVHQFKHSVEPFDDKGYYRHPLNPALKEEVATYFKERQEFLEAHPLPVELVRAGCDEYTTYILAVPGTIFAAYCDPQKFDPGALTVGLFGEHALNQFCMNHGIRSEDKPDWLLSSYYG